MQAEYIEIAGFLRRYAPFRELPDEIIDEVAGQVDVGYFQAGAQILEYNQTIKDLHVVRSGAVEVFHRSGELYNRLSEGGFFGEFGLLAKGRVRYPVKAMEDTLIYYVPGDLFNRLFDEHDSFAEAVEVEDRRRLSTAVKEREARHELLSVTVESLLTRRAVTISPDATIHEAAKMMTDEEVSSLLIVSPQKNTEPDDDHSQAYYPVGIITDKDLRKRVLAVGLSPDQPVSEVMSTGLVSVQANQRVFEAMLMMLRDNVHHLPVWRKGQIYGVLGLSDVVRHESKSSLYVVSSIFKQNSIEELAQLKESVRAGFVRMVEEDANSRMIGASMSSMGRSFKQRLLELGEEKFGPPPVPYCFIALGSMARDEQSIVTDQDNAMILHNSFDPKQHDEYFLQLAQFVNDGLDACGYPYCTGKIMANNKKWRQPLEVWEQYFSQWINEPSPEGLLQSSIFFDLEGVWGDLKMADVLNELIRRKAKRSNRFIASMAKNALNRTPPLGFFKDFVMEKDGKHNNSINIKRRGTAPIADLVRVHALASGSRERNSFARLEDVTESDILPKGRGADLRDALEFINMVRIRHQALALQQGEDPDNNVKPSNLSDFERKNLKDAFQILSNAQRYLRFRYGAN
ncbi:MAG: cyclic nucleotide-binding/CBS domain-containing protein [Idiomarina sp.]|nr:cyclic nucleotide-binding/CBS domain-containing protein [Idiomarina sp.]